jgi:hypothetical protein
MLALHITVSGFAIGLQSVGLSKGQTAAKPVLGDRYFFVRWVTNDKLKTK